jgi:hypothetical protein
VLASIAFCPSPPLLVPEVASGAAGELASLRLVCDEAVQDLLGEYPDEVVVLGAGLATHEHPGSAGGSFHGFGLDLVAGAGAGAVLPLALTVGAWLLDRARSAVPRAYVEITADATTDEVVEVGRALAARPGRLALLVVGDGSACRTPRAPGAFDPRAQAYDAAIATALGKGDARALADLDVAEARELQVSGRCAWLAAATAVLAQSASVHATLLADEAPYGVGYFVATWLPVPLGSSA